MDVEINDDGDEQEHENTSDTIDLSVPDHETDMYIGKGVKPD